MYSPKNKLRVAIWCVVPLMAMVSHGRAADGTRVLTTGLFVTGVALKFGSVFVENSAQDAYDQYLSTGIQADLAKHRNDYTSKHNRSVRLSRTGIGFVGLAVLISIFDQLDFISKSSASVAEIKRSFIPSVSADLPLKPSYEPRRTTFTLQWKF